MTINGEILTLAALNEPTLVHLLQHYKLNPDHTAVDINGQIISRQAYADTQLTEADKIELIHFVGGG